MTDNQRVSGEAAPPQPEPTWAFTEGLDYLSRVWEVVSQVKAGNEELAPEVQAVMYACETQLAQAVNKADRGELSPAAFRAEAARLEAAAVSEVDVLGLTAQQRSIAAAVGMPLAQYAAQLRRMKGG